MSTVELHLAPSYMKQRRYRTSESLTNRWPEQWARERDRAFKEAIRACGGNVRKAAKKLGIAHTTIYRWRKGKR
jgi:transcriptional regulator of acetoin/glycerol metabolism